MNFKFQTKLYVAYSVIILFAIVAFSAFIHIRIFRQIQEQALENNQQLCIKISENIDTYVEKLDDIIKKMISDPGLFQIMREVQSDAMQKSDYDILERDREIAGIISNAITLTSFPHVDVYLYGVTNLFRYVYNHDRSNFREAVSADDNAAKLERKKLVIYAKNDQEQEVPTMSFIRAIFDVSAKKYGYVEVQSDYKKLNEICDVNHMGNVILMDEKQNVIFPCGSVDSSLIAELRDKTQEEAIGAFRDGSQMNFYVKSEYSGLTVYLQYPMDTVYASLGLLRKSTFAFFICVLAGIILLIVVFSRMLVRPLHELRDSVLQVTYENIGLKFEGTYNNEIVDLRDAFQKILDDLKSAMQREIASSEAEAQARVAALQAQISPHFIHNVLYSISISAREGRTDDVSGMCKQLSDMLRYTVNSETHMVTLGEEMQCISSYLSLQKQYYEDFLHYSVEVEDDARTIRIPRLSILPFVENAIQHGFDGRKPPYVIKVKAEVRDDFWKIEIYDNGNNFPEEKIAEIRGKIELENLSINVEGKQENIPGMAGLGILNSLMRLNFCYEKGIQFRVENHKDIPGVTIYLEGKADA